VTRSCRTRRRLFGFVDVNETRDIASSRVEGFDLITRIGRGPRAEVWQARTSGGAEVALKIFLPHLTTRPGFLTQFEKETSPLTAVNHPNILSALVRGRSGTSYYLAAPLMRSGSLKKRLSEGPVPLATALKIGVAVLEGLDYAHRRGLVHRNLVPENVFVEGERVLVSDFGLSLLEGRSFNDGDTRSDLFSLGAILYELVTGTTPDAGPVAPSRKVSDVPARFDELIARALAVDPRERFGRASEMALALRLVSPQTNGISERHRDAMLFSISGRLITVSMSPQATVSHVESTLAEIDKVVSNQGPWRIAYDFGRLNILDDNVRAALLRFHIRHQRNLERVAFCSPRALVRASALVLGGSVKRVPWKSFAASAPMRTWLEKGAVE